MGYNQVGHLIKLIENMTCKSEIDQWFFNQNWMSNVKL